VLEAEQEMNIQEEIKKIDHALIDLILAGEFEMVAVDNHTTKIKCAGVYIEFWTANDEFGFQTYSTTGLIGDSQPRPIANMKNKRDLYKVITGVKDPKQVAKDLKEKRLQFEKLKLELGEV